MVIKSLPKGFKLNIITNKKFISNEILIQMNELSLSMGIVINILDKINDLEKFKYLSESRLLIFSSQFVGFGLPPVEAQYMNTPVICSDLPILREVNKKAIFDDFESLSVLRLKIKSCIDLPPNDLKKSVDSFAKFDNFVNNLKQII
jgi:glycosyltransferase involved in cell wall biosynthesis